MQSKSAGSDKRLYKQLEMRYIEEMARSASPEDHFRHIVSPFGPMNEASSRKTLFFLIATLNAAFPDYDFSDAKPEEFSKQPSVPMVMNSVQTTLFNLGGHERVVTELRLWDVVDSVIGLDECDVYSYNPDHEGDPNREEGAIWSFNYFFFNKKLKRIVFFTLKTQSYMAPSDEDEELESIEEDEMGERNIGRRFSTNSISYEEFMVGNMEF
ncbi:uncharacterized protein VTP21DRAFT_815 [Calcarisporiella thermophila]|uniref:uncharacterized protein n=1 Tax=Calcarisporiella thermophila TaxID=911321 RepID=UPI00374452E3